MTELILNQHVKRRPSMKRSRLRGSGLLKAAETVSEVTEAPMLTVDTVPTVSIAHRVKAVFKKLDPVVVYILGGAMAVVLVLVLTATVHSSGLPATVSELQPLPRDSAIDYLVVDFVTRGRADRAEDLPGLPQGLPPTAISPITYTLQRGDTVSQIALEYNVRLDTIISFNGITDVKRIYAGEDIQIPAVDGAAVDGVRYVVKPGDSLLSISRSFGVNLEPILDINSIDSTVIKPGTELFVPDAVMDDFNRRKALGTLFLRPFTGRLIRTSGYGMRTDPFTGTQRFHYGVDWAGPVGTPVLAANHGTVVYRSQNSAFGKYVLLKHDRGYQTLYAHLDTWSVRVGEYVQQGRRIGTLGNTGRSTGPHLHFGIYLNGTPVDPERVL